MDSLRASTAAPSRMRHERGESGSFCPPIPTRSQSADHTHKAAVWLQRVNAAQMCTNALTPVNVQDDRNERTHAYRSTHD